MTNRPLLTKKTPTPKKPLRKTATENPTRIASNVRAGKVDAAIIASAKNAIEHRHFRKANQIVVSGLENSKNPDAFLGEVLKDVSLQTVVANQLLDYKRAKTPSNVLRAVARSNAPFSFRASALRRLYDRGEISSTFTLPSKKETLEAKKTLEDYINYPWEDKGYPCPQPHICKVSYHKPKSTWNNNTPLESPDMIRVSDFNTGLQVKRASSHSFPNFFKKEQIACPFIVGTATVAYKTFLTSPEGAAGQIDVTSVPIDYKYGLSESVAYETVERNDGPYGYYEWEEVVDVKVSDDEQFPYVLAKKFFNTDLPARNLVDNLELDTYALAQSLRLISGMNRGGRWEGDIIDSGGPYWPEEVGIKPAQHFASFDKSFYTKFFTKTSNERIVAALGVEYENIPEYVKTATFAKEKIPLSKLVKTSAGNSKEGLRKKIPPAEVIERKRGLNDEITAVVYQKKNGEIEIIDGRKRISEALMRGLKEVEVIVGKSGQ